MSLIVNFGCIVQFAIDPHTVASLVINDKSIADITALEIGNVGENIAVRRAMYLCTDNDKQLIASYVHTTGKYILSCCDLDQKIHNNPLEKTCYIVNLPSNSHSHVLVIINYRVSVLLNCISGVKMQILKA